VRHRAARMAGSHNNKKNCKTVGFFQKGADYFRVVRDVPKIGYPRWIDMKEQHKKASFQGGGATNQEYLNEVKVAGSQEEK